MYLLKRNGSLTTAFLFKILFKGGSALHDIGALRNRNFMAVFLGSAAYTNDDRFELFDHFLFTPTT